jgi:hypothetical protein
LSAQVYYNFHTSKNISEYKTHFIWLSSISKRFGQEKSIDSYLGQPYIQGAREQGVQYFFIASTETPDFLLAPEEKNDVILTPATGTNKFTYEDQGVLGVTAHATALSNIRNRQYIDNGPGWLSVLFLILMAGSVFLVSWFMNISRSLVFSGIIAGCGSITSFVLFCTGIFVPVTFPIAASLFVFGAVSIGRFVYTTNRNELYEMVARRVFSAKQMERLKDEHDWREPRIVRNAVIMTLFPRRLPSLGETKEEAEKYTLIYGKYLSLVYTAVEKNDGNHIILSMDGVLGFWNVPEEEDGSVKKAYECAKECITLVSDWQSYIDSVYGTKGKRYFASFDICLHSCECYAGCLGTGNIVDYSISGEGVSHAIESALFQTSDKVNTISLTQEFYDKLASLWSRVTSELEKLGKSRPGMYGLRNSHFGRYT